jgi:serine/threonine-protein kinase
MHSDVTSKDLVALKPGQTPTDLVVTKGNDMGGSVSPDGKWLAYSSDLSGREDIYVKPIAVTGSPVQISDGGGTAPLWSPKGGEVFYRIHGEMWSVVIKDGKPGASRKLFAGAYTKSTAWNRRYSVSPDGTRFLLMRDVTDPDDYRRIHVVVNWSSELARMIPGGR